jgi:hypothetical protein
MRGRIALVCACLLACSSEKTADARETYDYLVTPAGHSFRLIGAGPILRGANTRLGLRITYVARALTKAELFAHADALVGSLGPEMQLVGDKTLTVRARIGPVSVALDSDKSTYDVEYRLTSSGFQRVDNPRTPPALTGSDQSDDPTFPLESQQLAAAAAAGVSWLGLLNRSDLAAIRARVTPAFQAQIESDEQLRALLAQRKAAGLPGSRRELYRTQQRVTDKPRPAGADVLLVYECTGPGRPRILERMTLSREADSWQIASYAFQPIPP